MKLNGKKIEGPNVEWVVLPRNGEDLIFKCQAVLDYKKFEKLCPAPKPATKTLPGGKTEQDFDDPEYKQELKTYGNNKYHYLVLESIRDTEGLEFETVNYDNPQTWQNWEQEFKDSGFSQGEIQALLSGIMNVNTLNQDKLDQAKQRFLASLSAKNSVA